MFLLLFLIIRAYVANTYYLPVELILLLILADDRVIDRGRILSVAIAMCIVCIGVIIEIG